MIEQVGKDVAVRERAPRLPGTEPAQLTVDVAEPERGLSRVHSCAEELELEQGLEVAEVGGYRRSNAEPRLADAEECRAVRPEARLRAAGHNLPSRGWTWRCTKVHGEPGGYPCHWLRE